MTDGLLFALLHLSFACLISTFPFPLGAVFVLRINVPEMFALFSDRQCVQVDIAPEFDINTFSSKYMAPLQYITWRKMFKYLKPGNIPLCADVLH